MYPREVDTRVIPGWGGTVELAADHFGGLDGWTVTLRDPKGATVHTWQNLEGREALEVFHHPFAFPETPDVFSLGDEAERLLATVGL